MVVISQTTAERRQETKDLFEQCKPYLDEGMGLVQALMIVKDLRSRHIYSLAWYKEVRDYAYAQGYDVKRR